MTPFCALVVWSIFLNKTKHFFIAYAPVEDKRAGPGRAVNLALNSLIMSLESFHNFQRKSRTVTKRDVQDARILERFLNGAKVEFATR
jgi:hypothetical protein